ncbi:hypothetical protein TNCV_678971 [Trichonephila clavipes]|nr:hypothetical protein TNCV_678971 [Trichonephila clavipes]
MSLKNKVGQIWVDEREILGLRHVLFFSFLELRIKLWQHSAPSENSGAKREIFFSTRRSSDKRLDMVGYWQPWGAAHSRPVPERPEQLHFYSQTERALSLAGCHVILETEILQVRFINLETQAKEQVQYIPVVTLARK